MSYYSVYLTGVKCIAVESSIDSKTVGALSNLAKNYFEAGSEIMGQIDDPRAKAIQAITKIEAKIAESLPNLISSIADERNDPDQLYIGIGNNPGNAVWPSFGNPKKSNYELRSGQEWTGKSLITLVHVPEDRSKVFSLWEYDWGSRDDFLGSFKVTPNEIGKKVGKLVVGTVEKSAYIIEYEVHKEAKAKSQHLTLILNKMPKIMQDMFKKTLGI